MKTTEIKKTIRDSVFDCTGADGPLCNAEADHLEIAAVHVSKNGIRSMTIEEQVAQLRKRLEDAQRHANAAEGECQMLRKDCDAKLDEIQKLKARLRKRGRK